MSKEKDSQPTQQDILQQEQTKLWVARATMELESLRADVNKIYRLLFPDDVKKGGNNGKSV